MSEVPMILRICFYTMIIAITALIILFVTSCILWSIAEIREAIREMQETKEDNK